MGNVAATAQQQQQPPAEEESPQPSSTPVRIDEIVNHLQKFKLAAALPPNLQYTPHEADTALEENLNKLFNNNTFATSEIRESLKKIVSRTDELMSDKHRSIVEKNRERLSKTSKTSLQKFYPCLMGLMQTLIIHCESCAQETPLPGVPKAAKDFVLGVWQTVLGELFELHAVIVYAHNTNLIDVGAYPHEWKRAIASLNASIANLKNLLHTTDESINQMQSKLNQRNRDMEEIRAKYANYESQLQVELTKKESTMLTLKNFTYIPTMVKSNIIRIHEDFENDI